MISEVYNCDCMTYMHTLPDKYFDLVIADPAYRDVEDNAPQKEILNNDGKTTSLKNFVTWKNTY